MKLINLNRVLFLLVGLFLVTSCGKDDDTGGTTPTGDAPVASFQFEISPDNFSQVTFSNFSQNASSYAWSFGDGNTSTDENPVHTYAAGGTYDVTLTASSANDSATSTKSVTIVDPNEALKILTGDVSKTWKLYREGTSMSLGPDADNPAQWWAGLSNDGSRPCLYEQEFTFSLDGTYTFDDKGMFWGEFGVWDGTAFFETCFEPTAATMQSAAGDDLSAWGSGTHAFSYDPSTGDLTLTGNGAWIGICKLGTSAETTVPVSSVSSKISIEQFEGYDVMLVEFIYDGVYWPIRYASYSDASLEPALATDAVVFGEDLDDITPSEMSNSFNSTWVLLDTIFSGSTVDYDVADPAGGSNVGQFNRTDAQFQELQFQTAPEKNDINFSNLTTVSVDVYLPSSNDYTGGLSTAVIIGLADRSNTEQWWTDHQQYENDGTALPLDEWVTVTFDLATPSFVANATNGATPYDRNDYDMVFLNIGGNDHTNTGTFYVRNLSFN